MNIYVWPIVFLMMVFNGYVNADEKDVTDDEYFRPANFYDGKKSLQSRIKFPEWDGDITVSIRCDALLYKYGTIKKWNFCFTEDDKYDIFSKAIMDAAEFAKLSPAQVDGKNKKVWFQYLVTFHKKDGKKMIVMYPNYGLEIDKFGPYYTSAQRYTADLRSYFNKCRRPNTNIWISATIDEKGIPRDVKAVSSDVGGEKCAKNLAYKFKKGKFIPAMAEGRPVASKYVESFFYLFAAKEIR